MHPLPRIELLTFGEELLLGLTPNGHLTFIGDQLARRGATLKRALTVADDAEIIGEAFRESWARADLVITTGGLGPTSDDRTRETIAEALGAELVFDRAVEAAIRERFARIGRPMTDNNLKQAFKPDGAEVMANPNGTAPGLWFARGGKILVMLPGPPRELQPMFIDQVVPRLVEAGVLAEAEGYIQLRTVGVGESALETKLLPVLGRNPGIAVTYCAHEGQVDVRLSAMVGQATPEEVAAVAEECRAEIGDDFLSFGRDSLAKIVSDLLRRRGANLAVAESCTGGLLASSFTDIPGASKIFAGGIVCYSNCTKVLMVDVPECVIEQHGAVSAEVAVAMACGVAERMDTDYGISITGFAGPCGGTTENPVGTIYIGLCSPEGIWSRRINYPGPRLAVKQRAVNAALDWLRRELLKDPVQADLREETEALRTEVES
jgi:nicotinamide-nucleotide amidase